MAAWLAKKTGHKIACLITIVSKNPDSYMFHTPSVKKTERQAAVMGIPLIVKETKGVKEEELKDLRDAIKLAVERYDVQAIVTGAVESVYQASRIQKICDGLGLECFNPLWQRDQISLLRDLLKERFRVVITGVSAYPLNASWLGRVIDQKFIDQMKNLKKRYKINPAGEGGEFESFVLECPLFDKPLKVTGADFTGEDHSWRMEIELN